MKPLTFHSVPAGAWHMVRPATPRDTSRHRNPELETAEGAASGALRHVAASFAVPETSVLTPPAPRHLPPASCPSPLASRHYSRLTIHHSPFTHPASRSTPPSSPLPPPCKPSTLFEGRAATMGNPLGPAAPAPIAAVYMCACETRSLVTGRLLSAPLSHT